MPNVTATIPEETDRLLEGAVEAGLYTGRSDGIRDALRSYFQANPDLARDIAIELYSQGKIDFFTATRLAHESVGEFRAELVEDNEETDG